jgi:glutamate synthase (NADPH) large chain
MTKYDAEWVARMEAEFADLEARGLYRAEDEHASCGVGLVVAVDGKPRRQVVENGIRALKSIWHRGAVDADGKTGDGAGIHVQIPVAFFADQVRRTGHEPRGEQLAVGQIFLPRSDFGAQEAARTIVETEVLKMGYYIYGWRHVPVDISCLGEKANATRPEIEQILISNAKGVDEETFERELYVIRRRIEKAGAGIRDFYICSLSCRSIIYKGMMLAEQVAVFYPELMDARFESAFAIYHQRYSTNTFPRWWLAQPFRMLAHNGEINTLKGNLNWLKSHEIRMASNYFGELAEDIKPIVLPGSSDSAALDAVFEVLVRAGRPAPMAKSMLVPEAWSKIATKMPEPWVAMYTYSNAVMEPWDGPAALAMTDGRWVCGGLDRNGLRPMRYVVTGDGLVIAGSEAGMVPTDDMSVLEKGALGPGQMLAVDMAAGRLYHDSEIKDLLAASQPFGEWVGSITDLETVTAGVEEAPLFEGAELRRRQVAAGYTLEELETILAPMAEDGKEAIGSMGDDTPPAVLSEMYRPLSHYFRQNFSQVTNPPIDSLARAPGDEPEDPVRQPQERARPGQQPDRDPAARQPLRVERALRRDGEALRRGGGRDRLQLRRGRRAGRAARRARAGAVRGRGSGARGGEPHRADRPPAGAGQDRHADDPGDERGAFVADPQGAAHLHLAQRAVGRMHRSALLRGADRLRRDHGERLSGRGFGRRPHQARADRRHADRGDGALSRGDQPGPAEDHVEDGDQRDLQLSRRAELRGGGAQPGDGGGVLPRHEQPHLGHRRDRRAAAGGAGARRAWGQGDSVLPIGGFYKARRSGETHAWEAQAMHMLQTACARGDFKLWKKYSEAMQSRPPIQLRDLLDFQPKVGPVPLAEVESITSIRKRFVTPGMSLGALSPEAHKTLNVAMNRIGAKSDSGEGGEDPAHFHPEPNGDNPSAKIKQVASGRFGVTAEYLNQCEELEIKIAQGAKPGEGGQLPGMKVTELIARLRHSTPGVTLISPPPHHDIYSIEDLAQLIYDLKQINPRAKVCVKLVSQSGVGTIAAGVAKAKADVILISGHNGGTGASPQTSIKYAGLPWEMGLSEAHQVLTINRLRDRVILRTDGGLRTGRDIVIAAMLGAEEFGVGTAALIAMGCIMVRQCQSNTCPVGVCTQDPALREKFTGTADKVVNLISFYAQEVREVLASVGAKSIEEVIGRADLLTQVSRGAAHLDDLDLNPLLINVVEDEPISYDRRRPRNVGARHAGRAGRAGRRAVLQGRREDAAELCGAEHAALDRHAGVEPHRAALRHAQQPAARPPDGQAERFRRPVARRLRRAGAEDRGLGRGQRLRRQGPVGRTIVVRPPLGTRWCRTRTRSSATRCSTARPRAISSPTGGPASGSACATRARRWWSRAAARTAANT